ncbi:DUF418 domain-containing protein [Frankia sp. AiPs1]|uniref:DUF418 domain-containing protein n=1 Tax=Frankia sp. AiPs1 TaxID=573493 RepID=UPI0020449141|nr:DUF418 domain-containing protein [Frankia sp. AiPs1]MCM3920835.1 DUF418 domain-containing protein [Frankia sp. AiPs1]
MTQPLPAPASSPGPVHLVQRALAPDLARGAMLLFIALANAGNCAFAGRPGIDGTPRGAERVVNFLMITLVNNRAYPVFAVMFGYSLVQLARRRATDRDGGRRVLLRRNACLIGFGFVHATLLYFGDFLGAYGIVGILATLFMLHRGDRFHRLVLWLWGIQTLEAAAVALAVVLRWQRGQATLTNSADPSLAASSYGRSVLDRLAEWPVHTATVIPFLVIVWLGIWAARRRILEDPAAHRTLLRRVACVGLGIAIAGALPYAFVSAGIAHVDAGTVHRMSWLHAVTGEYAGPGYVALFGLLAARLAQPRRVRSDRAWSCVHDVAALGRRSMTGYLFQSVVWLALFSRWALDLGGSTYVAALAGLLGGLDASPAAGPPPAAGGRTSGAGAPRAGRSDGVGALRGWVLLAAVEHHSVVDPLRRARLGGQPPPGRPGEGAHQTGRHPDAHPPPGPRRAGRRTRPGRTGPP